MRLRARILRNQFIRRLLCRLAARYIRLVYATGRWRVERGHIPAAFWDEGRPFILAFWHGRLLMMPYAWRHGKPMSMLISQHRDGELIARTIEHFGLGTVRGSPKRGGATALRSMLKALAGGGWVGITPDGPRGPRMRASDGVVSVARLSGVPVIPASYSARRRIMLRTWDHFAVPLPFSSGVFVWNEPIFVPRDGDDASVARARQRIEDALNAAIDEADRLCGHAPTKPAAPAAEATARVADGAAETL